VGGCGRKRTGYDADVEGVKAAHAGYATNSWVYKTQRSPAGNAVFTVDEQNLEWDWQRAFDQVAGQDKAVVQSDVKVVCTECAKALEKKNAIRQDCVSAYLADTCCGGMDRSWCAARHCEVYSYKGRRRRLPGGVQAVGAVLVD
jgi:hypothetical protein